MYFLSPTCHKNICRRIALKRYWVPNKTDKEEIGGKNSEIIIRCGRQTNVRYWLKFLRHPYLIIRFTNKNNYFIVCMHPTLKRPIAGQRWQRDRSVNFFTSFLLFFYCDIQSREYSTYARNNPHFWDSNKFFCFKQLIHNKLHARKKEQSCIFF